MTTGHVIGLAVLGLDRPLPLTTSSICLNARPVPAALLAVVPFYNSAYVYLARINVNHVLIRCVHCFNV